MSRKDVLREAIAALEDQEAVLGTDATQAAIAPLRAELASLEQGGWSRRSERLRLVTILFADVVGSTALARQLDPEDIHSIMDPALAALTELIETHGGQVLQYAGDSLLAVFGAHESSEDDPRIAVRAGLDVAARSSTLAEQIEARFRIPGFSLRVGLHSGRVLLGAGVDQHNSIRGMPVNIAARMEQSAPPGGVLISHDTWRLVRGAFDVVAQPPLHVKGVEEPVRSYLVQRERLNAVRTASRGIDGLETELVGRRNELDALCAALERADDVRGACEVVSIIGDAGLGKTRLVDEFERWASTRTRSTTVRHARALVQTQRQPFGLLRDLVLRRLGLSARAKERDLGAAFLDAYEPFDPELSKDDYALLGHLIGLAVGANLVNRLDNPRLIRDRARRAASHILLRDAESSTLMVILDDLHWADEDTLEWLEAFQHEARAKPVLIVAIARPTLTLRTRAWPPERLAHRKLVLAPLTPEDTRDLARHLLRRLSDVPDVLREQVATRAEGNPFYMEETIKMLLDDGVIRSDGNDWHLDNAKRLNLRIPHTLAGVLQARLDRLPTDARQALRQASIAGYEFWDDGLAAIHAPASEQLPVLIQREFIVPLAVSSVEGAREFRFHHHALHQVVRDSVLKADRQRYHLRIGRWLEARAGHQLIEFHGRIAEHLEQGGAVDEASIHYAADAEAALQRHSHDSVLAQAARGLAAMTQPEPELRWRLHRVRETVLATRGDRQAHQRELDQLDELAERLDDDARRAEAGWRRAAAVCHSGDYRATVPIAQRACTLARRAGVIPIAAMATGTLATAVRRLGEFECAWQIASDGLVEARACGSVEAEKELLYSLAALAAESGQLDRSRALDDAYLDIARATGDRVMEATGLNLLGDNDYRCGALRSARDNFERSYATAVEMGYAYGQCIAALNLAMVANAQRDYAAAQTFARRSLAQAREQGAGDLEAVALLQQGLAEAGSGDLVAAQQTLAASGQCYEANGSGHLRVEVDSALAQVALKSGDSDAARSLAGTVVDSVNAGGSLDGTEDPLRIRWDCYHVLQSLGDDRADRWLIDSYDALCKSAEHLSDPGKREEFLRALPHRRRLADAYAALTSP